MPRTKSPYNRLQKRNDKKRNFGKNRFGLYYRRTQQPNRNEGQILIEKSKTEITVTESQIRKFYNDALSKNSKMMVDLLIKVIILYDDKIEIFFKTPLTGGSDDDRGFSFALKKVAITYDVPQRKTPVSLRFDISLRI